jgi:hypothetical protein
MEMADLSYVKGYVMVLVIAVSQLVVYAILAAQDQSTAEARYQEPKVFVVIPPRVILRLSALAFAQEGL